MAEPVYAPVILAAKTSFRALGLHLDVQGSHHVPRVGGAVLASNHVSYLDFIFAGLGAHPSRRYVRFMAKDGIWKNPVAGPLMRGMKHIPVDRTAGAQSFRVALDAARRGEIVGIFPEATISRSFELKEFKSGVTRLAQDAGVPILPTIVWGTQRLMTKDRDRDLSRGKAVSVTVGTPITLAPEDDADATATLLHEVMRGMLDDAIGRYPQTPTGPDDTWWMPARLGGSAPTLVQATRMDRLEALERSSRRTA
jgi:1-acyl-sn-glycerol-3-phosphate acyltransferase